MISEIIKELNNDVISLLLVSAGFVIFSIVTYIKAKNSGYTKIFWLEVSKFCLMVATFMLLLLLFVVMGINTITVLLAICTTIGIICLWRGYKKSSMVIHIRE